MLHLSWGPWANEFGIAFACTYAAGNADRDSVHDGLYNYIHRTFQIPDLLECAKWTGQEKKVATSEQSVEGKDYINILYRIEVLGIGEGDEVRLAHLSISSRNNDTKGNN